MSDRGKHSFSFYGPLTAIAGIWLVCAVVNAAPPATASLTADAVRSRMGAAAHPHAMGAQATQAPSGTPASAPSTGCMDCHKNAKDPHPVAQNLSCVDCHGGNGAATTKEEAHVKPAFPEVFTSSANPPNTYTILNHEKHDFIRFMNPSDLRTAHEVCGRCHDAIVRSVAKGPMVNSAQVYSTGLYNNSSIPWKDAKFVENYTPRGEAQIIRTLPPPTERRDAHERDPAGPVPAAALRERSAGEHLPDIRARRRPEVRARESQP